MTNSYTGTMDSTQTAVTLGRQWVYGLLGTLFDDVPDAILIDRLHNGEAVRLAAVAQALGVSAVSVARIESAAETDATSLNLEYTSLFEARDRIHPFASCQLANKPRLMGKPWAAVTAFYARLGVGLPEDRAMRADHIGTELLFISHLAARQATATEPEAVAMLQHETDRFMSLHARTWMPEFCGKIREDERSHYYAAFCELTEALLAAEPALSE